MITTKERISAGDSDARFYKKKNNQNSKLEYQVAFATDIKEGIITRVMTIPGCDNMSEEIEKLIENKVVSELTLDGEFSIGELIALAQEKEITLNVPMRIVRERNIYPKSMFEYNKDLEAYICPNGKLLNNYCKLKTKNVVLYIGIKTECNEYHLVENCTKSKEKVRTIERTQYDSAWETHSQYVSTNLYQFAKVLRGIIAEGKFLEANNNYSLNISKHVSLPLMQAQAQITAIIINLKRFIKVSKARKNIKKNAPPGPDRQLIAS